MLSFARNIIVARLVSPEDFGIAATFAITVSLLEMISDLAADKLIIQAIDGDDEKLQATAQLWQVLRGACAGVIIAMLAWPISRLFDVPQARWAFVVLGLVPLMRGLVHLDIKRLQRDMRFGPQVAADVGSQLIAVLAAWPLAAWLRDYSAMLWLVVLQAGVLVVISHLVAKRRYSWAWDRASAARLVAFGWPLLINGVLLFGILEGDRLVVGSMYSMNDLGLYSVAAALTLAPSMLLGNLCGSLLLPILAQAQDDRAQLIRRYSLSMQLLAGISGMIASVFILVGRKALVLFFGVAYWDAAILVVALAIMQAVRLLRYGPTMAAMAQCDTQNSMIANSFRVIGLPFALLVASLQLPLQWVAIASAGGEILGLAYSIDRLQRRQQFHVRSAIGPIMMMAACVSLALLASKIAGNSVPQQLVALTIMSGLVAVSMNGFEESRQEIRRATRALIHRVVVPHA